MRTSSTSKTSSSEIIVILGIVGLVIYPLVIAMAPFDLFYNSRLTKAKIVGFDSRHMKRVKSGGTEERMSPVYEFIYKDSVTKRVHLDDYFSTKPFNKGETDLILYISDDPDRIYVLFGSIWYVFFLFLFYTLFYILLLGVLAFPKSKFFRRFEDWVF